MAQQRIEYIRNEFGKLPGDVRDHEYARPDRAAELGYPLHFDDPLIDGYGTLAMDLIIEDGTGEVVAHEMNSSNYQGFVGLTGESDNRCRNEVAQTVHYLHQRGFLDANGKLTKQVVVVYAHQPWASMRTASELYPRAELFRVFLHAELPRTRVKLLTSAPAEMDLIALTVERVAKAATWDIGSVPGTEDVTIITGDVIKLAEKISVNQGRFQYYGRDVVFVNYPLVVTELVRQGKLAGSQLRGNPLASPLDWNIFHGGRLIPLGFDKGRQQELMTGTGIKPLPFVEAGDFSAAVETAFVESRSRWMVIKPFGTSGGVGVELIGPVMSRRDVENRVAGMLAACERKYGSSVEKMVFPLQAFPFVRSTGFALEAGKHLWDMRVAVLIWPGRLEVAPLSIRLTPAPFDLHTFHTDLSRGQWVSNVSDRRDSLIRSALDVETLETLGISVDVLNSVCESVAKFTRVVWDIYVRGGFRPSFEDQCDQIGEWDYGRQAHST